MSDCPKCWWKSKTLWFALVMDILMALEATVGLLQPLIGPQAWAIYAVVLTIGIKVFRTISAQAITFKAEK